MARKTLTYTVQDNNRDKSKQFLITEMSAAQAENWAMRAILALIKDGVDMPEGFEHAGMAGMAEMGLRALQGLSWDMAEPLINEMMACVQYIPDPSKPHILRPIIDEDIEEVMTRVKLKIEVWNLHTDFLKAATQ